MTAEALNCPNCGAAAQSDCTQCEFCKTRLKTMACPSCFGLMFIGSKFCGRCGAIAAPVEVIADDDTGDCPRCRKALEKMSVGSTTICGCTTCEGLWVGAATFESICADRESQACVLGFLDKRTVRSQPLTKVNYVPCPDCGQLMNRNNFAKTSGVIVDICKQHGVWFDADELPAIIKFIHEGGMKIARERERNEIDQERQKLSEDQRRQGSQDNRFGIGNVFDEHNESGIRGFVQSLFS